MPGQFNQRSKPVSGATAVLIDAVILAPIAASAPTSDISESSRRAHTQTALLDAERLETSAEAERDAADLDDEQRR